MVNKVIVLIQARILSQRLKGKILFSFFNENVIDRIIRIVKKTKFNKEIVLLSGNKKNNLILKEYSKKHKIKIFFGSENDVLDRFKKFIKKEKYKNQYILRITSDNYLIQPSILDLLVKKAVTGKFDYAYIKPLSHYAGELIKAQKILDETDTSNDVKNHVTIKIRKNKKIKKLALDKNFFGIDHTKYFTLDTMDDLIEMKKLEFKHAGLKKLNCIDTIKDIQKKWKS